FVVPPRAHRDVAAFPTRRSSDLGGERHDGLLVGGLPALHEALPGELAAALAADDHRPHLLHLDAGVALLDGLADLDLVRVPRHLEGVVPALLGEAGHLLGDDGLDEDGLGHGSVGAQASAASLAAVGLRDGRSASVRAATAPSWRSTVWASMRSSVEASAAGRIVSLGRLRPERKRASSTAAVRKRTFLPASPLRLRRSATSRVFGASSVTSSTTRSASFWSL